MGAAPVRPILLFDVLGTLVVEPFGVEIPRFFGMSLEELLEAKHPTAWAEFERGEIDEEELGARFFRDGRPFDRAGLKACTEQAYRFVDGMEELLGALSGAGLAIHALSNYPVWYRTIEERLRLSRFLAWSFVSCDTGVRKPDPRAFTGAAATLGVDPGDCLLIDDREENCASARRTGMDAVHFRDARSLRAELAGRGVPVA